MKRLLLQHVGLPSITDRHKSVANALIEDSLGARCKLPASGQISSGTFSHIVNLLERLDVHEKRKGRQAWAFRPRIYTVLRGIGGLDYMDTFIQAGFTDLSLPLDQSKIPRFLKDSGLERKFLATQTAVLTDAREIETSGRHGHLEAEADGTYESLYDLGRGGHGTVDCVFSRLSLQLFARKRFLRRASETNRTLQRTIEDELSTLKDLRHIHLVKIAGSYTDPFYIAYLMHPVAECNLRQFLKQMSGRAQHHDMVSTRFFFGCLAGAIYYLHSKKIRHRDLKPENILVYRRRLYIADFGSALNGSLTGHNTTSHGRPPVTEFYKAPEFAQSTPRNESSDMWSLGLVFVEISTVLAGKRLSNFRSFLDEHARERKQLSYPYAIPDALNKWVIGLQSNEDEEDAYLNNEPLSWATRLLQPNPKERLSAKALLRDMIDSSFCADYCCEECEPSFQQLFHGGAHRSQEAETAYRAEVTSLLPSTSIGQDQLLSQDRSQTILSWLDDTPLPDHQDPSTSEMPLLWDRVISPASNLGGPSLTYSKSAMTIAESHSSEASLGNTTLGFSIRHDSSTGSAETRSNATIEYILDSSGSEGSSVSSGLSKDQSIGFEDFVTDNVVTFGEDDTLEQEDAEVETQADCDVADLHQSMIRSNPATKAPELDVIWTSVSVKELPNLFYMSANFGHNVLLMSRYRYIQLFDHDKPVLIIPYSAGQVASSPIESRPDRTSVPDSALGQRFKRGRANKHPKHGHSSVKTTSIEQPVKSLEARHITEAVRVTSSSIVPRQSFHDHPVESKLQQDISNGRVPERTSSKAGLVVGSDDDNPSEIMSRQREEERASDLNVQKAEKRISLRLQSTPSQIENKPDRIINNKDSSNVSESTPALQDSHQNIRTHESTSKSKKKVSFVENQDGQKMKLNNCKPVSSTNSHNPEKIGESRTSTIDEKASIHSWVNETIDANCETKPKPPKEDDSIKQETITRTNIRIPPKSDTNASHERTGDEFSTAAVVGQNSPRTRPKRLSEKNISFVNQEADRERLRLADQEKSQFADEASKSHLDPAEFIRAAWSNMEDTRSVATTNLTSRTLQTLRGPMLIMQDRSMNLLGGYCRDGKVAAVRTLLERGVSIKGRPQLLRSAIRGASKRHIKCVQELIKHDVDVNQASNRSSALHLAIDNKFFRGYNALIGMLLAAGAEVNQKDAKGQYPILKILTRGGDEVLNAYQVETLALFLHPHIPVAIDVNVVQSGTNDNALHLSIRRRSPVAVALLVHGGANVNARNASGTTPLLMAANQWPKLNPKNEIDPPPAISVEQELILEYLVQSKDIRINATGGSLARTALHHAVLAGSLNAVSLLLKQGADPGVQDKRGDDAISLAKKVSKSMDGTVYATMKRRLVRNSKNSRNKS